MRNQVSPMIARRTYCSLKPTVLFICAYVVLLTPPQILSQSTPTLEDIGLTESQLHAVLLDGCGRFELPGIQAAIVIDTAILFSKAAGYASLSDSLPATTQTVYRIGSVTKPFTAMMLVKLFEEGVLRLDDPVSKYLPDFQPISHFAGTQPITLRQLATHQSGLPLSDPQEFLSDLAVYNRYVEGIELQGVPEITRESLLQSLSQIELEYPPYSPYGHYSNLGYRVLGLALERASGKDFEAYVGDNILEPLGMIRSGFDSNGLDEGTLASGYVYGYPEVQPQVAATSKPGVKVFSGGMYSTAEDLCRLLSLQFQANPPGGAQVISPDGLRMMHWTAMDWGFSFDPNYPALYHGGSVPGFRAHVIFVPGLKLGVAVLTNRSDMVSEQTPAKDIAWFLVKQLKPGLVEYEEVSDGEEVLPKQAYVGRYVLGNNTAVIDISLAGDMLYSHIAGLELPKSVLYECGPGRLCYSENTTRTLFLEFDRPRQGLFARLSIAGYHFVREDQ